ncbi:3-hydroxyacyl-ACP dehydratase FabZ [Trichlorobacter ammonificans]|uniref:3-hydroxyacyl-[acyl-carrier-protein] dehydratase FabZ n=1 Tax=Trichlorobacter ammonificans TaxID=2916410 RepID=A0ABM9D5P5_9BACT|nr:3-hydroxyacyl-ACP dehydratase FabZ [Trichlorobacter ammonificans]CAH2030522.1 3-hydroxy-acyl-[acyl-carrier-protein] dehydratase [Trichlorobacter ammonificans]
MDVTLPMDVNGIMAILPHRYPFLLVDRIVELEHGTRCVGIKNVTINEPFFPGHFPGHPVMPGVLIVEAMAQVAGIMAYLASDDETRKKVSYFMAIDNAKFRKPVVPGDQLRIEIVTTLSRRGIWGVDGKAYVDGKLVTEASLKATFAAA